jgi:PleD family two-component response regulator
LTANGDQMCGLCSPCSFSFWPSHLPRGTPVKAILFVDDHEVLARLSCEILEMHGYRAVSAYSAQDSAMYVTKTTLRRTP